MKAARIFLCVAAATGVFAVPSHAQLGPEGLLSNVTDVSFFASCWNARSPALATGSCPSAGNGLGVELSFEVATIGLSPRDSVRRARRTTTWKPTEMRVTSARGRRPDTTVVSTPVEKMPDPRVGVLLEFALGYSQYSGFRAADSRLDLRGAIREAPSASLYATLEADSVADFFKVVAPYVGIRTGIIQLDGVHLQSAAMDSVVYGATGRSLEGGGVLGVVAAVGRLNIYGEAARMVRRVSSVDWTSGVTKFVPSFAPREFDFSGWTYSLGVQIQVKASK